MSYQFKKSYCLKKNVGRRREDARLHFAAFHEVGERREVLRVSAEGEHHRIDAGQPEAQPIVRMRLPRSDLAV